MKRLDCLDGLRGLLALYVLLGHMAPFAALPAWTQALVSHGGAAVDLFFALSGLVIVQSLRRPDTRAVPFLIARAARIFPVYLPVLALAILIQPVSCGFETMPWLGWDNPARGICVSGWPRAWLPEILAHLTMTHGLFPNAVLPDAWVSFLGAAWSLSTEWQFYAVAILVRNRRRLGVLLLALAGVGAAWRLGAPDAWQFSRAFLPNQAHYFALGVASVGLVLREPGARWRFAGVLAAVLLVCASTPPAGKIVPPLVWAACLAAQLGSASRPWAMLWRILRHRLCLGLGAASYCLYLVNEPIHKILGQPLARLAAGDPDLFSAVWVPAAVGLPIAVSALLHVAVEKPALTWGRARAAAFAACAANRAGRIQRGDEATAQQPIGRETSALRPRSVTSWRERGREPSGGDGRTATRRPRRP